MAETALLFSAVSKSYGAAPALQAVDLAVSRGESFGLVGMNGAGKTTLIKCLLDFCSLGAGRIEIFGVAHHHSAARSRLTFLPERFVPPYYLTGRDFLEYMLELQSVRFDAAAVERTLRALDLDASALRLPVRHFSKGMTQKLGLAACLLSGRELLVLDEPTSGLDPKARALLKARLAAARAAGHTVFLTSHALADVDEICDRIAVLHAGRSMFTGTPAELRARYATDSLESAYLRCIDGATEDA